MGIKIYRHQKFVVLALTWVDGLINGLINYWKPDINKCIAFM